VGVGDCEIVGVHAAADEGSTVKSSMYNPGDGVRGGSRSLTSSPMCMAAACLRAYWYWQLPRQHPWQSAWQRKPGRSPGCGRGAFAMITMRSPTGFPGEVGVRAWASGRGWEGSGVRGSELTFNGGVFGICTTGVRGSGPVGVPGICTTGDHSVSSVGLISVDPILCSVRTEISENGGIFVRIIT
jgi:hypothetical protein